MERGERLRGWMMRGVCEDENVKRVGVCGKKINEKMRL